MGSSFDQIGAAMAPTDNQPQSIDFYPFAYALFDENLGKHCWYCLDDEKKHKRCTGCHKAMFCDQNCQLLAWKDHKFECRGIRANDGTVPDIEVRLLGRIVTRHKAIASGMDKKDPNFYKDRHSRRNIMDIWAHTKSIEMDSFAMGKFEDIFCRLSRFYESKALLPKEVVFELHCRDFINRHAISDKNYLREIGKGLYLDLCAYDHSCRPNTVYSCRSFVATLRPLHSKVKMHDRSTTFYSYIDLLCAKQDRRKLLKDTWYFRCECERCEDDTEHILSAILCPHCPPNNAVSLCPFGQSEHKDAHSQLLTCPRCGTTLGREEVMEAIGAMRFINEMLDKTDFERMGRPKALSLLEGMISRFQRVLPPINVYFCKIVQALVPHIDQTDNERLMALHLLVEPCLRQCYPRNHPALAFHLRNIGIFAKEQGDRKMAEKYLVEALQMFEFVMGPQHSLTTLTAVILNEILKEKKGKIREETKRNEEEEKGMKREEEKRQEEEEEEKEGKEAEGIGEKKNKGEEDEKKRRNNEEKGMKREEEKRQEEDEEEKRVNPCKEEERKEKAKNGGGSGCDGTRIMLKIEPPEEEEEQLQHGREGPAGEEQLVTSLVRMSINKATCWEQEKALSAQECHPQPNGTPSAASSPSRPESVQSGAALSPHCYSSSEGGGAKKKLKLKKAVRRKRTPLPPKQSAEGTEDEEEKSEASTMGERGRGQGAMRKGREQK